MMSSERFDRDRVEAWAKIRLCLYTRTIFNNIAAAGALSAAYTKGENEAWMAADNSYARQLRNEYSEGFEAGFGEAKSSMRGY